MQKNLTSPFEPNFVAKIVLFESLDDAETGNEQNVQRLKGFVEENRTNERLANLVKILDLTLEEIERYLIWLQLKPHLDEKKKTAIVKVPSISAKLCH